MKFLNKNNIIIQLINFSAICIPFFFQSKPCNLCLIERSIFILFFVTYFLKNKISKYFFQFLSILLIVLGIYHTLIVLKIIKMPKFCKLHYLSIKDFYHTLASCDNSNPVITFSIIILGIILFALL